jgi:hypothetical protein
MLVGPAHAALEDREVGLNRVGVDRPMILAPRNPLAKALVGRELIKNSALHYFR